MSTPQIKFTFPKVRKVTLKNFSLYSVEPIITVDIPDGVFCLAGANGLGKSTFLSAVIFAITGVVSDPTRKFESVDEYYKDSKSFAEKFFTGRISETDRDEAEVSIELTVGKNSYQLTRGVFEPTELRSLTIYDDIGAAIYNEAEATPNEYQKEYTERIAQDVGVNSFQQLVFILHYVLTFDERRHLLFWDNKVLEQALFLAFGVSPDHAKRADALRRDVEKSDSRMRNSQWQATQERKKIEELEKAVSGVNLEIENEDIGREHEKLLEEAKVIQVDMSLLENELKDAELKLVENSAKQAALRSEYAEEFSKHIQRSSHLTYHPLVVSSLADSQCALCGTAGAEIPANIRLRVEKSECPLCGSSIEKGLGSKDTKKLQAIDKELEKVKSQLEDAVKIMSRLKNEIAKKQNQLDDNSNKLNEFERLNNEQLAKLRYRVNQPDSLDAVLEGYRKTMEEYLGNRDEHKKRRDEKKKALSNLQRELEERYATAQSKFVPIFTELAYSFIGIDLDIRMETSSITGTTLVLDLKNTPRRSIHQLSESQRFFIDIALRMALSQFMSKPDISSSLFIDTPEGSLDIAYESRAGDMLAQFVEKGNNLLMTANINSSQLLLSLAKKCGRARMKLCRMTSWTELSDVQIQLEDLFKKAYQDIENVLDKKETANA